MRCAARPSRTEERCRIEQLLFCRVHFWRDAGKERRGEVALGRVGKHRQDHRALEEEMQRGECVMLRYSEHCTDANIAQPSILDLLRKRES